MNDIIYFPNPEDIGTLLEQFSKKQEERKQQINILAERIRENSRRATEYMETQNESHTD
jgi:hypothetical protein